MKSNISTTSTPKSTPVKKPLAQVIEQALATVTDLPWFESFNVGTHTDSASKSRTFSREDLQQMVDNFEPDTVPFLTGHPKADAPAYGFAKEIKLSDDDKLYLNGDNVDIGFAETVVKGHYGKRSIGIDFNEDKGWYIDHVAFLGATKPALKLQPVGQYKFTAEQETHTSFDFSIETQTANTLVRFLRKFQTWLIANGDSEEAKTIVDEWDLDWLQRQTIRAEIKEENNETYPHLYSKTNNPAEDDMSKFTQADIDTAVAQAKLDAQTSASAQFSQQAAQATTDKDRIAELEKQNLDMQFNQQVESHQAWINQQVSASKLLPAQAIGLAEFMAHIGVGAAEESGKFTFSQGAGKDVKTVTQSPVEFMKAMVENGGKHSLLDNVDDDAPAAANFSSSSELNDAVLKYQGDKQVSYAVALDAVIAGGH
ncbi:MAG: hypothetical protein JKY26_01600 [Pseudomonas sp.]|nr:hypothetical protein [Pseudomonas sp.]